MGAAKSHKMIANVLDFRHGASVTVAIDGVIIDHIATEEAVRLLLSAIRVRLHKAGRIAQDRDA